MWVPIYFPVLTRASGGFVAFSGIIQYAPAFCAPIMRPSPQRATTRRLERCRRSAASIAEMYFMPYIVYISSLTILYSQLGIMSRGSNCFTFTCKFSLFLNRKERRKPPPCTVCVSVFDFYFCFFFFAVTSVPITVPPLMSSNAIHSMRLLVSPVGGDFGSSGSFTVTVSALAISLVPSLLL